MLMSQGANRYESYGKTIMKKANDLVDRNDGVVWIKNAEEELTRLFIHLARMWAIEELEKTPNDGG